MFQLDTNVLSELRIGRGRPAATVLRWAATTPRNRMYISAVTLLELETGVLSMERKDARQGYVLRRWLRTLLEEFSSRILPFQTSTALLCAALHVPDRRPERDAMIAATAKEHGYTLVTRNTKDFAGCGIQLLDPWDTPLR